MTNGTFKIVHLRIVILLLANEYIYPRREGLVLDGVIEYCLEVETYGNMDLPGCILVVLLNSAHLSIHKSRYIVTTAVGSQSFCDNS